MKKSFMAAALAACLVGTAQAVSVGWNTLTGTDGAVNLSGTSYTCGVNETKTYAVIISNVSNLSQTADKTLFAISAGFPSGGNVPNQDPKVFIKQRGDGDGTSTFKYQSGDYVYDFEDVTPGSKPGMTNDETAALAMTIARGADGAGTVTFYLDGSKIGTASFSANENALSYIVYGKNFDGGSAYDGDWELYVTDDTVTAAAITADNIRGGVVPEPTALALLALGVAGVALRRRAA